MRRDGRAEFIVGGGNNNNSNNKKSSGSGDSSGGGGGEDYGDLSGSGDVVWIFWRTPEEWAALIEAWVDDTALKGAVLTLYELSEGEDTIGTGKSGKQSKL
jgi:ESCRT-II complex subunit VPS25